MNISPEHTLIREKTYTSNDLLSDTDFHKNGKEDERKIIHDSIDTHIQRLCKQLCYGNRFEYNCTLDSEWDRASPSAALCEWGNASYDWMLNELNYLQHQNEINDRKVLKKKEYYGKILCSSSLWERYKNWRFKRRLRVPDYIKALDPDARQVFWWLYDKDEIENISQRLGRPAEEIKQLVTNIHRELSVRKRSYLLQQNVEFSLESLDPIEAESLLVEHQPLEMQEIHENIKNCYQQLTWLEQFVLDAMVVDDVKAASVVVALKAQSISVSEKVSIDEMNVQHVYYFLRKTIAKLKQLSGMFND